MKAIFYNWGEDTDGKMFCIKIPNEEIKRCVTCKNYKEFLAFEIAIELMKNISCDIANSNYEIMREELYKNLRGRSELWKEN